jgi:hypothetical protein
MTMDMLHASSDISHNGVWFRSLDQLKKELKELPPFEALVRLLYADAMVTLTRKIVREYRATHRFRTSQTRNDVYMVFRTLSVQWNPFKKWQLQEIERRIEHGSDAS